VINTADFSTATVTLTTALGEAATDPADAIRLLLPLAGYTPPPIAGSGPLWQRSQNIREAIASNLRCAACSALARAAALYQPVSYQDAQSVRLLVCDALDAEATRNADDRRDASYAALRRLFWAVALDLATRGAQLARLVEVTTQVPLPSLAETWSLYQDTSREPELVASAAPHHPLFMPVEFPALEF
jgi:prophage DNA circulation protein